MRTTRTRDVMQPQLRRDLRALLTVFILGAALLTAAALLLAR
jgi:hypothetical protein